MRAVVAAVGATLRVDTLSPSSTAQVVCKTNFLSASGCLAIQTVAQQQRVCSSFHKVEKALDVGLQNKRRFNHSNSFACRCSASGSSEDASNVPQEGDHTNDGEVGPSSVWDLPSRHKQMQVYLLEFSIACARSMGSLWKCNSLTLYGCFRFICFSDTDVHPFCVMYCELR